MNRCSLVTEGAVVVVGLGVGAYLWQPWTKGGQPSPIAEASAQVQSTYRQLLDFVPSVPTHLPPGYKVLNTQVNTDKSPIPTSEMKKFSVSYSNGKNDVLTLIEDKKNIPQPLNGMSTSRVKVDGNTITVGKSSRIALVNFHLHGVYISASLISSAPAAEKRTNATPSAGALKGSDVTKQRQELLNFVKNMVRQPTQIQAQPDYAEDVFEGQYAVSKMPFQVVTPSNKSLGQYQPNGENDPIAQITKHASSSLSDIFYMYFSDTGQISVDERQGAYQQHDGSWKRATDLGAINRTITVNRQKVYRSKDGLSMMWIEPQKDVLFTVASTSKVGQAQARKVMASVIKRALALNSSS